MFTTEVLHKGGEWFAPYTENITTNCIVTFHDDDITDAGCAALADVLTVMRRRWHPRGLRAPRGPKIPITIDLEPDMPPGIAIVVDDHAEYIHFTVRADLISERGADLITRHLSEHIPNWIRVPAKYQVQLRAV
ncbi:hypothetical protein ACIGMX_16085 [Streptomyces aquilus]|uniref:hypothetical protein n=1 Tax=Streptomyces aquilus TaxID=2548456 RepID=UPI0037D2F449